MNHPTGGSCRLLLEQQADIHTMSKISLDPLMMMRRLDLKCLGIMQPTQEKYTKSWQTTYAGYSLVDIHVANGEVHETWARDSVSWL